MVNDKSLVIYFSRADENYAVGVIEKGNTEVLAEYIKDIIGADLFKVERKIPYSKDYDTCLKESKEEKNTNARPELERYLDSIDGYNTIYIGCPIYWGTMPNPMFTQLERLNWQGKNVRIFTTHEGNELGQVPNDVRRICAGANILPNSLAVYGHEALNSKDKIEKWIRS